MMSLMDTDYAEEEVVENPTLKAAYNLAPLHQNQTLKWNYEVDLIGKKQFDKIIHLCEVCELPILMYGRTLPCKHIFCFTCARKSEAGCKRCGNKVQKVEELALGTVYICTYGAPKHSTKGCRRTYLSHRDLQSHIAHRHVPKAEPEPTKTVSQQPQLPLTQQQAQALQQQHPSSQSTAPHSSSHHVQHRSLPSSSSYVQATAHDSHLSSSHQLQHQSSMPGAAGVDLRTNNMATSAIHTHSHHTSSDVKSNPMHHGLPYSQAPTLTDQSMYRSVDAAVTPRQPPSQHSQQQLTQPMFQHHRPPQQNVQMPMQQHRLPLSHNSAMPVMPSKPGMRYNSPVVHNQMSSAPMMSQPRMNQFPAASSTITDMQGTNQPPMLVRPRMQQPQPQQALAMHHQQQHLQQPRPMSVRMATRPSGPVIRPMSTDMADFDHRQVQQGMPNQFNTGQIRPKLDHFSSTSDMNDNDMRTLPSNRDAFNNMQQQRTIRQPFNNPSDRDNFRPLPKIDSNYGNISTNSRGESFPSNSPNVPTMMSSSSNLPPNVQGVNTGLSSRSKNVNLITVPLQDEDNYRPLPYASQSQHAAPVPQYTSNLPGSIATMPSNFPMGTQARSPMTRMPQPSFNRPANPQAIQQSQPRPSLEQVQSSINHRLAHEAGFMGNNNIPPPSNMSARLGSSRIAPMSGGNSMPMNMGSAVGNQGGGMMMSNQGGMMQQHASHSQPPPQSQNQSMYNTSSTASSHWQDSGNMRPLPTHLPPPSQSQSDGQYQQQNYY